MGSVCTVRATLTGVGVAHGLTRMSFTNGSETVPSAGDVSGALAALHDLWNGLLSNIVTGTVITFEPTAVVRDVATGLTTDEITACTIPAPLTGTSDGEFVSGTGARIDWRTGVRRASREVRGATFVIPMSHFQFNDNGDVATSTISDVTTAADGMLASFLSAGLIAVVYGRPLPVTTHHGALAGVVASITAGVCNSTPAFLRRRRS